jgi:protocatechuate 3,4-dioxygenase beta subunit
MVRNDVRENSEGLDVELDIQIIDLATCEPVTDAFVEIWHANATG